VLDALLADTQFAWALGADGTWSRVDPAPAKKRLSAQELLMTQAIKRARRR
jgi:hypothetical protein